MIKVTAVLVTTLPGFEHVHRKTVELEVYGVRCYVVVENGAIIWVSSDLAQVVWATKDRVGTMRTIEELATGAVATDKVRELVAEGHRQSVAEWLSDHEEDLEAGAEILDGVKSALEPLAKIADAYDKNDLDECRPEWLRHDDAECELYCSRGGRSLLKLKHALQAREVLRRLAQK